METVTGKPRQRAWKPKARSGCKTCKIRKVKCDEEKPHCKRCTSTGRTCDGYDPTFRPTHASSPVARRCSSQSGSKEWSITRTKSPIYLAPAMHLDTTEERESFDFFTSHAISKLRGFLDSPFWQREVLQAAHCEPAIQHYVVAMGAMYRRFYEGHNSHLTESAMADRYLQFAFLQSNQAIKSLLEKKNEMRAVGPVTHTNKITLMTCAILFSSMCCLQGYQKHAIEHLRSGIRMLNEMDEEGAKEEHAVDLESLRTIFVALDAQIRAIMPSHQSRSWVAKPKTTSFGVSLDGVGSDGNEQLDMGTLQAMQRYMECLLNHIHAFNQNNVLRDVEKAEEVSIELGDLVRRFQRGAMVMQRLRNIEAALTFSSSSPSRHEFTQPLTALELMQCQMEYLLRHPRTDLLAKFPCLGAFQSAKEPFETLFEEVALFKRIFKLCNKLLVGVGIGSTPVFMTSMGPTAALWFIAIRAPASCQVLRKRAVGLMLSHPRREGFWDGMVAGWIAREALRLEQERTRLELGFCDPNPVDDLEVPDRLRIVAFWLRYPENEDRKVEVGFSDAGDIPNGIASAVRWITW